MNSECIYCSQDERLSNLMMKVDDLSVSTLYLFKEQTYGGRCVVALKDHYREIFELPDALRDSFLSDVVKAARAVDRAFSPDKMNYGAFGDTMPHVHFHIVPKYKDGYTWGKMFEMNPAPNRQLTLEQYDPIIARLREAL